MKHEDLKSYFVKTIRTEYPSLCKHLIKDSVDTILRMKYPKCLPFSVPTYKDILNMLVANLRHEQSEYETRTESVSKKNRRQVRNKTRKEVLDMLEMFRKPRPAPIQEPLHKWVSLKPGANPELGALMDAATEN